MVKIKFPDGSVEEFKKGVTGLEIAKFISEGLARVAIAIKVNEELQDLSKPIEKDASVKIITFKDKEGVEIFRHSTAHLMAHAVVELFPYAKPTIGPVVDEGFYYDFDHEPFKPEDIEKIEKKMKELVKEKIPIERIELSKKQALEMFKDNQYKIEMINELEEDKITAYKQGKFVDLCKGPHVPNTKMIKAFKLTKIAGAYWRGDSKNKMLTRIYGIAFPDKEDLKKYLHLIEEAKKRDHKLIGKQMELFSFHEEGPGFPFFHNKGSFIFDTLVNFMKKEMIKRDYEINRTPIILNKELWLQSGHWDHYRESMYFTKIDEKDFAVKPMNCPGNILVYKSRLHSYRELPIKAGEFGLVHRHELSGVLSGLFRVRSFVQDDAHVFCSEEQLEDEIIALMDFIDYIYQSFGFRYNVELSTRPEKALGSKEVWDLAEKSLENAMMKRKMKYKINPGEGAFYGPKIDYHLKDAIGRTWQCATIQVDFSMPEKFDLQYEGKDGKKHRPVMVHRAIYGAVERFMAILIEHFAGKFPMWLSPIQVRVLSVSEKTADYASKIGKKLKDSGLRMEIDNRSETVNKKIREAEIAHVNYILVVGEREKNSRTVNVRTRKNEILGEMRLADFIDKCHREVKEKR